MSTNPASYFLLSIVAMALVGCGGGGASAEEMTGSGDAGADSTRSTSPPIGDSGDESTTQALDGPSEASSTVPDGSSDGPTDQGTDAGDEAGGGDAGGAVDSGAPIVCAGAAKMAFAGPVGDVTRNEADSFYCFVANMTIPTSQYTSAAGSHNDLADGFGGAALEAINRMYEVTGDIPGLLAEHAQLLDLAIRWSDAWLSHRNDLPLGEKRVMWTGDVAPVWPPDQPPSTYAGCEVGETVGILAYTALNILKTPSIAGATVPDGDPNGYGVTYMARARTYVTMLEFTMDNFFNKYFLDTSTLTIQHPSSAAYDALASNNVNAWNREMMFLHAWQTLAQVHQLLGDSPAKVTEYGTIARNTVDLFVSNAQPLTAPDGAGVYDWGYGNFGDEKGHLTGEQLGIHAQYDMWGLTRAYRYGFTSATAQQMKTYADTVVHEIAVSPGVYASYVDRCCSTATYDYLPEGFVYLTPYNTAVFAPAATADVQSGRQPKTPSTTAALLWAKHFVATGRAL